MELIIFIAAIVLILLFGMPCKKAYAWKGSVRGRESYDDIHYTDTKAWCGECGMGPTCSAAVGRYCSQVDQAHALEPAWHLDRSYFEGGYDSRSSISEEQFSQALYCLDIGDADDALYYLGSSLHPLQDRCAHMRAGYYKAGPQLNHGEWDTVQVLDTSGYPYENRMMGKLFDDPDYDYAGDPDAYPLDGQWYYLGPGGKYYCSRWIRTRQESMDRIGRFMSYASQRGIYYNY